MKTERWQQIEDLYHSAIELRGQERAAYLEGACADDKALRKEVERLIAAEERDDVFLIKPAWEMVARDLAANKRNNLIGQSLGRYHILSVLGVGGMGEVYRASDVRLGREVAIKVLPEELTDNQEALQRFEREARAVATLSHPNILAIHDFGTEQNIVYAVTELLKGETLRSRINRGPIAWTDAIKMVLEVAEGLSAAHAKGIIHRDLKPDNIFITDSGWVKILDFGLARVSRPTVEDAMSNNQTLIKTETGVVMGTVGYMSPEQVRGEKVDEKSDVFSFGCVLYEILSGKRAFMRKTTAETAAAILRDEPPKLTESCNDVPVELEQVIGRCLKKDPEERYQSVRDLADALKAISSGSDIRAFVPLRKTRRLRLALSILMILLLLVPVTIYLRSRWSGNATNQPIDSLAVLPLVNASGEENLEYLSDGITESLINSLSRTSPNLRVIARNTVFRYKGRETDPTKVGSELGVRAVVMGKVVLRGDMLNIQVDLVDAADGRQLWGEQFEKKLTDLLSIQGEIASRISSGLRLKLTVAEQERLTKRYTQNIEAYQLYMKGRFQLFKFSKDGMEKGIELLNEAIRVDPNYAFAYAGLAEYYMIYPSSRESGILAKKAALTALELDDTLAEAHYSLALVSEAYDWQWAYAEKEFQRAIALNPGSASAHDWYGFYLAKVGRTDEAVAELKLAQQLDPLSVHINTNLGRAFYFGRRYGEAIDQLRKAIDLDPNFWMARIYLGLAYEQQARYEEALAEFRKTVGLWPGALGYVGYGLALSGKKDEAMKVLDEFKRSKSPFTVSWAFATLYTGLGEKDQALDWLEKAFDERFVVFASIKTDPVFDSLRSDPRFADLLKRSGLAS